MKPILELDPEGGLYLPAELLKAMQPHTRFVVRIESRALTVEPEENPLPEIEKPETWDQSTPEERAKAFRQWALSHQDGVGLSEAAMSRETMYD